MLPTELAGRYEERGTLGAGAMGTVIEAFDRSIQRRVAVKLVRLPAGDDPESQDAHARFRREAQAAGRLSHPNIVGVYDYGENADTAWIVMEMVEGGTLKGVIGRGERMPVPQVLGLMDQLLAALAYSHRSGVVHRDIKPGNLMLTGDGVLKVADFGVARIENSSMTQVGTVVGTPSYMAPEQFSGEPVDARADIWAAGVVLYQLLTGERPFEGSYTALMHRVLKTEPPPPSQLSVSAPRFLDAVVARALAKRPDDRFPSAAAFAEALRGAPAVTPAVEAPPDFAGAGPLPGLDDSTLVDARNAPRAVPRPVQAPAPPPAPAQKSGGGMGLAVGGGAVALLAAGAAAFFLMGRDPAPVGPTVAGLAPPPITQPVAPPAPSPPAPVAEGTGTPPVPTPPVTAPPIATPSPVVVPPVTAPPSQTGPVETATPRPNPDADTRPAQGPAISALPAPPVIAPPPVVQPSVSQPPVSQPPVSQPPVSQAPVSQAPVTPPPVTQPPVTQPPITQPPVTQPPVIQPPVVTPAAPRIDFRGAALAAANAAPCSLVTSTASDQSLTLSGVVRRGGEAQIRRVLAARNIPSQAVTLNLQIFDGPYCGVLDTIRQVAAVPGEAPMVTVVGVQPLQKDELVRLDVQMPDRVSYLHAVYFAPSTHMAHLVPYEAHLRADHPQPAGARVRLGEKLEGWPGWQVDEPYGTDLILILASDRPLFTPRREGVEPVDAYLGALAVALRDARAQGNRVAARAVVQETVERR